jgi:hypothetical protein
VLERAVRQHPDADPRMSLPTLRAVVWCAKSECIWALTTAELPQMQQAPSDTTNLLLARMSQRSKESDIAAEQYLKALSSNVWLWEAYTALCDLGTYTSATASSYASSDRLSQ